MKIAVSIIICTCNRAEDLSQTLAALGRVCVPESIPAELLVVDNASTDATAEVVRTCRLPNMPVRYVHEPRRGKGYAYNTGMAQARGEVFLFTDDDVRPPHNWIAGMCRPILEGTADAVAGGVCLAPHLERPWLTHWQQSWLAATDRLDPVSPTDMVGANMAFSREVITKVPAFDVELGPGALGYGDESLFSWQLRQAGYRIAGALDVVVEHHFDQSRLLHGNLEQIAVKAGKTAAYIGYHWQHSHIRHPWRAWIKRTLMLKFSHLRHNKTAGHTEGMSDREMLLIHDLHLYGQYLRERKRPRNYEKHGLVKRDSLQL